MNAVTNPEHQCATWQNQEGTNHIKVGDRFWLCWSPMTDSEQRMRRANEPQWVRIDVPRVRYCDRTFAVRECERLANANPNQDFYVLVATTMMRVTAPVPPPPGLARVDLKHPQAN